MTIIAGPFDVADGEQDVDLGAESGLPWHEIAISLTDSSGNLVEPIAGSMQGAALGVGSDQFENFSSGLNLPVGQRRFTPFFSIISRVKLTPVGVDVGTFFVVTIVNTRG